MEDSTNLISNSVSVSQCLSVSLYSKDPRSMLPCRGPCGRSPQLSPNSVMDCLCLVMSINESKQGGHSLAILLQKRQRNCNTEGSALETLLFSVTDRKLLGLNLYSHSRPLSITPSAVIMRGCCAASRAPL